MYFGTLFFFRSPGSLVSVLTTLAVKHSKGTKYLKGDATELHDLLDHLRCHDKRLTNETNGKTALLKALLNLKGGNNTIEVLLDIAEKTGDLENLINASYTDPYYKGQTALHVAIERRSFEHVKLLVQKGADVQAKANGKFFQRHAEMGFYSGELPLSLAACTNQPDIVSFLMENPYRRADVTDRDSQGNTVLHTLVVIADNTKENTDMIAKMYDEILVQQNKLDKKVQFVEIENNDGMTPLKLAAKLGKIELFRHMLHREFMDEETRPLSRKFTEWIYGPVHSSLYDMTSIDTDEKDSVLEIIVFGSEIPMLQIEPLRSLLQTKWESISMRLFLFIYFLMARPLLSMLLQISCEYVGLLVLSLALAWVNLLYYLRGSKVRVLLLKQAAWPDMSGSVYSISIVALIHDSPPAHTKMTNDTAAQMRSFFEPYKCVKPSYNDICFTTLELFKFTIGMGDLQISTQSENIRNFDKLTMKRSFFFFCFRILGKASCDMHTFLLSFLQKCN
uniref:Uncharacterized protein n=1 Tax=Pundamilia nyererei TaxID=303518 RepID=A0A3B4FCY9_9CICH